MLMICYINLLPLTRYNLTTSTYSDKNQCIITRLRAYTIDLADLRNHLYLSFTNFLLLIPIQNPLKIFLPQSYPKLREGQYNNIIDIQPRRENEFQIDNNVK